MKNGLVAVAVVSACYIAAQMLADIASLRIVLVGGLSMDAGTLVYPFTFTLRDMVHKVAGLAAARALIVTAAAVNVAMALLFWVVAQMQPDPSVGPQAEFVVVLSPIWRIVAASIVAEVIAELVDTEVYRAYVKRMGQRKQWGRVLISNAVSVPLDSLAFSWLAFGGVLPNEVVWAIFLSNVIVKAGVTIISIPGIYLVRERSEIQ
jgi:queuosine precursor transporter